MSIKYREIIDICSIFNHFLLPQRCLLCDSPSGNRAVCDECFQHLPFHVEAACPVCALPSPQREVCGACLKKRPFFDATRTLFDYAFPIDALLRTLKYQGKLVVADWVGQLMSDRIQLSTTFDMLIPMPMHPIRLKERGFNQALEIGRKISKLTQIPLDREIVIRKKHTEAQASLPLDKRLKNMRDAFECSKPLQGKRIAMIDDVMTSGASLNELARTLKANGALYVEAWVAARTLIDSRKP